MPQPPTNGELPSYTVRITRTGFEPALLVVPAPSLVSFVKATEDPSITYEIKFDGEKTVGLVDAARSLVRTFATPGQFSYACLKYIVLKGRIVVEGGAPPALQDSLPVVASHVVPEPSPPDYTAFAGRPGNSHDKLEKVRAAKHQAGSEAAAPPKFLFGSFGEDSEVEDEPAATKPAAAAAKQFPLVPSPKLPSDTFDVAGALEFLRKKWADDGDEIKWV